MILVLTRTRYNLFWVEKRIVRLVTAAPFQDPSQKRMRGTLEKYIASSFPPLKSSVLNFKMR